MNDARGRYLARRAVAGPWQVEGANTGGWPAAVVIPACDEDDWLFATLDSLVANPPELCRRFLVLVVVNQTATAAASVRDGNRRTLERLRATGGHPGLSLAWIDAASPGRELAGGPGPARRLGLDRALAALAADPSAPLVCLDADTLVDSSYLPAIHRHFAVPPAGGAVLPFAHQPAATPELQRAIDRYELYLRSHVLGLQLAGSPYAFHTIGSAMACTARAYVRCGGMNQRAAAEDFYFLQALAKTDGVATLAGTCVRPAARVSSRVVFGTGPALERLLADAEALPGWPPAAYSLVGRFLALAADCIDHGADLPSALAALHPALADFWPEGEFAAGWDALCRNHRQPRQRLRALHGWFDALQTLRLLRHLAAMPAFTPQPVPVVARRLLALSGQESPGDDAQLLFRLREMQNGGGKGFPPSRVFG